MYMAHSCLIRKTRRNLRPKSPSTRARFGLESRRATHTCAARTFSTRKLFPRSLFAATRSWWLARLITASQESSRFAASPGRWNSASTTSANGRRPGGKKASTRDQRSAPASSPKRQSIDRTLASVGTTQWTKAESSSVTSSRSQLTRKRSWKILRDWLEMESDPRSHTKQLCSCDLVWFRGSFLCNPRKHTKTKLRHYQKTQF